MFYFTCNTVLKVEFVESMPDRW